MPQRNMPQSVPTALGQPGYLQQQSGQFGAMLHRGSTVATSGQAPKQQSPGQQTQMVAAGTLQQVPMPNKHVTSLQTQQHTVPAPALQASCGFPPPRRAHGDSFVFAATSVAAAVETTQVVVDVPDSSGQLQPGQQQLQHNHSQPTHQQQIKVHPVQSRTSVMSQKQRRVLNLPIFPHTVPNATGVETLDPDDVFKLLKNRHCILVDVRDEDRAAGIIEGSIHVPAIDKVPFYDKVPNLVKQFTSVSMVVFTCQYSAHRGPQCANWYREKAPQHQRVAILAGGFRHWEALGLPVSTAATKDEEAQKADEFAVNQGVQFVKQHVPKVYDRAQQLIQQGVVPAPAPQRSRAAGLSASVSRVPATRPAQTPQQGFAPAKPYMQPCLAATVPTLAGVEVPEPDVKRHASTVYHQAQQDSGASSGPEVQEVAQTMHSLQPQRVTPLRAGTVPQRNRPPQVVKHKTPQPLTVVPTDDGVEQLEPDAVFKLMQSRNCVLVDVRREDRMSGLIDGADHVPAIDTVPFTDIVPQLCQRYAKESLVIFTCQYSVHRAPQCANWYRRSTAPWQRVGLLKGGFRGWQAQGLPVASQPQSKETEDTADDFAMRQGVSFVKQYVPAVYTRAQQQAHGSGRRETAPSEFPQLPSKDTQEMRVHADPLGMTSQDYQDRGMPVQAKGRNDSWVPQIQPSWTEPHQDVPPAPASEEPPTQEVPAQPRAPTMKEAPQPTSAPPPSVRAARSYEPPVQPQTRVRKPEPPQTLQEARLPLLDVPLVGQQAEFAYSCDVPLMEGIEILEPGEVFEFLKGVDTVLIDVRDADRASGLIPDTHHVPAIDKVPFIKKVPGMVRKYANKRLVVFTCQYSKHRAPQCANMYGQEADPYQRVAVLAGGFRGWEAKGLPVMSAARNIQESIQADDFALRQGVEFVRQEMSMQDRQREPAVQELHDQEVRAPVGRKSPPAQPQREPAVQELHDQEVRASTQCKNPPTQPLLDIPFVGQEQAPAPVTGACGVPSSQGVENVEPEAVYSLLRSGNGLLVDVRDEDRAAGLIEGSVHVPAIDTVPFPDKVPELVRDFAQYQCVLFTCQYSRHRAPQCASWYRERADPAQRVGVLSGGFRGWEAQGLPIAQAATTTEEAQAADEIAMQHGQHFVKHLVHQANGPA